MKLSKWQDKLIDNDLWQAWIIAEKVWIFLGQIRFLSKETNISNESLKILLQTKEELLSEIQKSWSKNLIYAIKKPEQEIIKLLKDMLINQDQKKRRELTNLCMRRDFFSDEQKKIELENIKNILNDLDHLSEHIKDEKLLNKIESFKKYLKSM